MIDKRMINNRLRAIRKKPKAERIGRCVCITEQGLALKMTKLLAVVNIPIERCFKLIPK